MKSNTFVKCYPFALKVNYVGTTVKDACEQAVEFSRHLRCIIQVEINDVELSVCGSIMSPEDVYAQWEYEQKRMEERIKNFSDAIPPPP